MVAPRGSRIHYKTPFRDLRLHRGLVELVKALQRLREGSMKALRSSRGGAGASTKWMRHDGVMERSRGLRGASVVAKASRRLRGAFVEPSRSFGATLVSLAIRQIMTSPGKITRARESARVLLVDFRATNDLFIVNKQSGCVLCRKNYYYNQSVESAGERGRFNNYISRVE